MNELIKEELCGNTSPWDDFTTAEVFANALAPNLASEAWRKFVKTSHAVFNDWNELVKMVHHAFAYGLQCNDMTHGEVQDDIAFALDKFAKKYGLPEHDWDTDYEDLYGGHSDD